MQNPARFRSFKFRPLALAASALLVVGSSSAFAGTTEVKALQTALTTLYPSGTPTLATATSSQLLAAFENVIAQTKYNTTKEYGIVAGEALKAAGPNALDAGSVFASAISTATTTPLSAVLADESTGAHFLSLAAKTAGTGTTLNVTQIVSLSAGLIAPSGQTTAITAAENAANKPGAGAILGGFASELSGDTAKTALAETALADKKLNAGAQDFAHYIGAQTTDSAAFAVHLSDGSTDTTAKFKYALPIAIGAATGDPTDAGNIAHTLFGEQILTSVGTLTTATATPSAALLATLRKSATKLATSMAAVADIEQIQQIGNAIALQIATPSPTTAGKGAVLLSTAAAVTKALAAAIMAKPKGTNTISDHNSDANKQDEFGELAAYMVGGLLGSPELAALESTASKATTAAKDLLNIILAVTATKPKTVKVAGVSTLTGPATGTFSADVAASVAYTVQQYALANSSFAPIETAFQALLQDSKGATAKKIGGTAFAAAVANAVSDVYTGTNTGRFENGLDTAGAVSDPETDSHPFNGTGTQS